MRKSLIPFYRDLKQGNNGYTLFLDKHTNRVYKSHHPNNNQLIYWGLFFLVLIVMRAIKNVHLPLHNVFVIFLVLLLIVVSLLLGIGIYRFYYRNLREVYYTEEMIESYIDKGKKSFVIEVITTIVVILFMALFTILFIAFHWIIWLIFALFSFTLTVICLYGLPLGRFKLYKK